MCFEPSPRDREVLALNLEMNNCDNVTVVARAVSDAVGTTTFANFAVAGVGHILRPDTPADATLFEIDTVTLDSFVFDEGNPPPTFIKIDVEGAEAPVIEGARRLLDVAQPIVVAEVRSGESSDEIGSLMSRLGYRRETLVGDNDIADVLFTPG